MSAKSAKSLDPEQMQAVVATMRTLTAEATQLKDETAAALREVTGPDVFEDSESKEAIIEMTKTINGIMEELAEKFQRQTSVCDKVAADSNIAIRANIKSSTEAAELINKVAKQTKETTGA